MSSGFSIDVDWTSADHGPEEVRQTSAFLRISVGGHVVTRIHDDWSKSVHDEVRLSAYPFALWLASSWWRLRWEPAPRGTPDVNWRMAHDLAAAGQGFLWPRLLFVSDGEFMDVLSRASVSGCTESLRYLENRRATLPVSEFERVIDDFVGLVISRLGAVGVAGTHLESLWKEVRAEREEQAASLHRRLEARLGLEPDEAPEDVVTGLKALSDEAGSAAVNEIAPVCSGKDPAAVFEQVMQFAASSGVEAKVSPPEALRLAIADASYSVSAPWDRGRLLARAARVAWGIDSPRLEDDLLSDLLGVATKVFQHQDAGVGSTSPLSLAIRGESDRLRLLFRKHNRPGRRFEAARFLADDSSAPAADRWLPATDTKTARQKLQRAFAAELLCPIDALRTYLDDDFSSTAIEDAAEYFSVSPLAVRSHLALNGLLPLFERDPVSYQEA